MGHSLPLAHLMPQGPQRGDAPVQQVRLLALVVVPSALSLLHAAPPLLHRAQAGVVLHLLHAPHQGRSRARGVSEEEPAAQRGLDDQGLVARRRFNLSAIFFFLLYLPTEILVEEALVVRLLGLRELAPLGGDGLRVLPVQRAGALLLGRRWLRLLPLALGRGQRTLQAFGQAAVRALSPPSLALRAAPPPAL